MEQPLACLLTQGMEHTLYQCVDCIILATLLHDGSKPTLLQHWLISFTLLHPVICGCRSWKHPTSTMHVNSSSSSSSTRADSTRRPDAPLECASLYKRDYMPWQKASPGRPYIKTHKPKKHKQPAWQPGSLASEYGREYHKLDTPQTKQQSAAAARQAADADAAHCTFGAFDAHTIYTDTYTAKHGRMRPSCKASGHKNAPGIASRVFDDSTTYKACFTAKVG